MGSINGEICIEVEGSAPEEEEIWRRRRERMNTALAAAPTTGQQEPADLKFTAVGNVDDFIEKLAVLANPSAVLNARGQHNFSLLHKAAYSGKDDILRLLLDYVGDHLIAAQDDRGKTPLHYVARDGGTGAAEMLIRRARQIPILADLEKNPILRMKDKSEDTPLHVAVYHGKVEMARYLLSEDLEPVYWENANRYSPLYLAFSDDVAEMHDLLISLPLETSRIEGYPPVLAAVAEGKHDLLSKICKNNRKLLGRTGSRFLNVFHLAAYGDCCSQISELIGEDTEYLVREWDSDGYLPIDFACIFGNVELIKILQPYSHRLNGHGQNILHVAAKYGRDSIVTYILSHRDLRVLINDKDDAGNTAVHLAAMHSQPAALIRLLLCENIDVDILNNKLEAAPGIARDSLDSGYTIRKQLTHLAFACSCEGRDEPASSSYFILSQEARDGKSELVRSRKKMPDWDVVKEFINSRMVVAALVATVTFAAGFAVPGGFRGSDTAPKDDQGMATMLDKRMFQVFVICNTMAMFCSLTAVAILIWARVSDVHVAITAYERTTLPLSIALPTMGIAFLTGVTLTVAKLPWLANSVFYLGLFFLLIISTVKFLECPPLFMIRDRRFCWFTFWLILAYIKIWKVDTCIDNEEYDGTKFDTCIDEDEEDYNTCIDEDEEDYETKVDTCIDEDEEDDGTTMGFPHLGSLGKRIKLALANSFGNPSN